MAANTTIHDARLTHAPAFSGLRAGTNCSPGIGTLIPVHIPLGRNIFLYVGDLPPSQGTGVFIPKVNEIFHGGAEAGDHSNTRRSGLAKIHAGEEEEAELIGIELYNLINFNT